MKLFVKTRENIARRSVKKKVKTISRSRSVHNFSNSGKIGIYFNTSDPAEFKKIREFSRELEKSGIKTNLLGIIDSEEIPGEMALWENCQVILYKDLDWCYRPEKGAADAFIESRFDILFDMSHENTVPGYFITSLSLAQFKVGRYREEDNDIDLMINTGNDKGAEYLIEQVKIYVSMLNRN